jgi:hypothetical protein
MHKNGCFSLNFCVQNGVFTLNFLDNNVRFGLNFCAQKWAFSLLILCTNDGVFLLYFWCAKMGTSLLISVHKNGS